MNAAANISMKDAGRQKAGEVLLGEDWVSPEGVADTALREGRGRRGLVSLNRSPLARKIIIFNLMALVILVAGVLFMNPFRDSLVLQREQGLMTEAQLIADVVERGRCGDRAVAAPSVDDLAIGPGVEVFLFDPAGALVAQGIGRARGRRPGRRGTQRQTIITDFLNAIWDGVSGLLVRSNATPRDRERRSDGARRCRPGRWPAKRRSTPAGRSKAARCFRWRPRCMQDGEVIGVVALTSAEGEIDRLVRYEREQVLQMFVMALLVSIGLSLVLASTIANPLVRSGRCRRTGPRPRRAQDAAGPGAHSRSGGASR